MTVRQVDDADLAADDIDELPRHFDACESKSLNDLGGVSEQRLWHGEA